MKGWSVDHQLVASLISNPLAIYHQSDVPLLLVALTSCFLDQLFPSTGMLAIEPNLFLLFHFFFQSTVSLVSDVVCLFCSVSNIPSSMFLFPQPPFSLFSCFSEAMSSFSYLFGTDALVNSSYFPSHHSSLSPPFIATYNQLHVMDSKVYIHYLHTKA